MIVILQILIATILIAGMILSRLLMDRRALQGRIRGRLVDTECEQVGCFRGCDQDAGATPDEFAGENT
jgi:hypothetical protein